MQLMNNSSRYGVVAKVFHWLLALAIVGLFALGLWMRDLGYYDPWYQTAPHIHQSIGVLVILFMLLRYLWRQISPPPADIATQARWEHMAAHFAHGMLYLLVLVICISGYLINADENSVPVFNWFEIPSLLLGIEDQEELMGEIHDYGAWVVIILAAGHALAAIKHHIIDRDDTLRRML